MTAKINPWTKEELKIYILLLCANADSEKSEDEIQLIKSKTDSKTFEKIYNEFCDDNEDESFEKIDENVQLHDFSPLELNQLRKEMQEVFLTDKRFSMMEDNMNRILDNIIY
ncbi:MAG: hypothetical protein HKO92_01235 [Flavobacteriaceae bacterium]|nr:hypothetical protein [Bacteroidia bacterium]NNK81722.1 hypothetical protein [Flavobacteriaceae bacterium]